MLLRDKFWLWGHPEGCYNNKYGNTGISRMTPMEACLYLGIKNTFMVPDGDHQNVQVNRRQYNKSFKTLQHVGWEFGHAFINANGNTEAVDLFLEEVKEFPNISCALFDGIILWTWAEKDISLIPEKFEILKRMAPAQRYMFGCYLWNFGENKEATRDAVKWQLDWYRERIYAGEAEGVVFHTNTMADLDYDAYDAAIEWMEEHGDEVLPE